MSFTKQKVTPLTWEELEERKDDAGTPAPATRLDYSSFSINIGIEQTGLKFQLGKLCRPTSRDVEYCLLVLQDEGVLEDDLYDDTFESHLLFGPDSFTWKKRYVHRILNIIGVNHDPVNGWQYPLLPDEITRDNLKIMGAIWILMCWDWTVNYQDRPEPLLPGVFNKGLWGRVTVLELRCPLCGKAMPKQDIRSKTEVRYRVFRHWLLQHGLEYHKFGSHIHKKQYYPTMYKKPSKRS